jgi:hypothetical protein
MWLGEKVEDAVDRVRHWVDTGGLRELWDLPADSGLAEDLRAFDDQLRDPWFGVQ